jgi:regulator of replication initiation timing
MDNDTEISQPYARELARQVDELEAENAELRAENERLRYLLERSRYLAIGEDAPPA